MSGLLPKEKLTAYQRWELAAFDEAEQEAARAAEVAAQRLAAASTAAAGTQSPTDPAEPPPLTLPTAAEIERMHIEAHDEGYAAGFAEGQAEGKREGHKEGCAAGEKEGKAAAQAKARQIDTLLRNLQQSLKSLDQEIADQLLATAIEIANRMLLQSLRIKPELLLPVVREAVSTLSAHSGHPALFAHPDDAELIRSHLGEQLAHNNWRIIDDPTLTPGGCRAELGASEVDATFETRWRRVLEAIGVNTQWLENTLQSAHKHE